MRTVMCQPGAAEAFLDPDWTVNYDVLAIALKTLGWSRSGDLAPRMGFERTHVDHVINGNRPVHPHFRMALWEALGGYLDPRELFVEPGTLPATGVTAVVEPVAKPDAESAA